MPYLLSPYRSFDPIGVECDICQNELVTDTDKVDQLAKELGWYDDQAGPDQVILCPECAENLDESIERVYEEREGDE